MTIVQRNTRDKLYLQAMEVACSKCLSGVGQRCTTAKGTDATTAHMIRWADSQDYACTREACEFDYVREPDTTVRHIVIECAVEDSDYVTTLNDALEYLRMVGVAVVMSDRLLNNTLGEAHKILTNRAGRTR
jgi:hypothetical protein